MEIILLEKIINLGGLGDRVNVKPGYARNFLIPKGKATAATPKNVARFEARRAELERIASDALFSAQKRADKLQGLVITVTAKAGNEGRLFGSIGAAEVVEGVTAIGIPLKKQEVRLTAGAIRQLGEYEVDLQLHPEVRIHIQVNVISET